MTDLERAREIAGKLTKAQRKVIRSAEHQTMYDHWVCRDANRVRGPLLAKKLVFLAIPPFSFRSDRRNVVLTPLGLAVRRILEDQNNAG